MKHLSIKVFLVPKNKNLGKLKKFFIDAINYNKKKDEAYINLANIYLINKNIHSSIKILFKYLKV